MKNLKPWCIENSSLPMWVSKITGLSIWAFSFFIFIFCVGKFDERLKYRRREQAYLRNPFEQEAYNCEEIADYLPHRIRFNWIFYKI